MKFLKDGSLYEKLVQVTAV